MEEFYKKLLAVAIEQKETCDALLEFKNRRDPNYRCAWGKLLGYCDVLYEMQAELGLTDELPVERTDGIFDVQE